MKRTRSIDDVFTASPSGKLVKKSKKSDKVSRIVKAEDAFKRAEGFTPRQRNVSKEMPDGTALGRKKSDLVDEMKKKEKPKKKKFRSFLGGATPLFLGLFLAFSGFVVGSIYLRTSNIFANGGSALALNDQIDPNSLTGEGDGRVNFLLLGKGGPGHDGADLTDTVIVASLDPINDDVALLSIPRDFWVPVPGNGSMKINSVYATYKQQAIYQGSSDDDAEKAGIEAIENTVESILGIKMNYYSMVDFKAFEKAINTVGGIEIDVKEQLYDPSIAWENNWDPLIADVGRQTFNGKTALLYARSRQTSARGDFDRADRQREVIVALGEKVLTLGTFSNPIKMAQLLDEFGSHVRTNISISDMTKIYDIANDFEDRTVDSINLAGTTEEDSLVTTANIGGLSVVIPVAGVGDFSEIQHFIRNQLKDGFIRKEDPKILVLNGTSSVGLATEKEKELKSFGYNVIGATDAPTKNFSETLFIDLTKGDKKYTKRYMELRFKTEATEDLPNGIDPGGADFVIILGRNATTSF